MNHDFPKFNWRSVNVLGISKVGNCDLMIKACQHEIESIERRLSCGLSDFERMRAEDALKEYQHAGEMAVMRRAVLLEEAKGPSAEERENLKRIGELERFKKAAVVILDAHTLARIKALASLPADAAEVLKSQEVSP